MTREREEAIKLLTQYIDYDAETPDYYEMEKACKVALKALKQEPCEDCISRAEAIKALEYDLSIEADGGLDKYRTVIKDLLNAIYNTQKKAIEDLPSIQPKPKTDVLDKIRTEIEQERVGYPPSADYYKAIMKCLQIIDKYKAESEE